MVSLAKMLWHIISSTRLFAWCVVIGGLITALVVLAADIEDAYGLLLLPLVPLLIGGWIVLMVRNLLAVRRKAKQHQHWLLWGSVPLIIAIAWAIGSADIPFRFAMSRSLPAMDALAAETLAAPPDAPPPMPRDVGFFHAAEIHRFPGGMAFRTESGNWFDWNGFAYIPSDIPPTLPGYSFGKPLGGHWFDLWISLQPYPRNAESIDAATQTPAPH